MLEAVFNHKSDFARTPKYGIERKTQPWRICKYMPLKSLLPIAEMGFAIYFTYFVWFAIRTGSIFPCPFSPCFNADFSTSLFPRSASGGHGLISASGGKLHFLRDKLIAPLNKPPMFFRLLSSLVLLGSSSADFFASTECHHSAPRYYQRARPEIDGDRTGPARRDLSGLDFEVWPGRSLGPHGDAAWLAASGGENWRPCSHRRGLSEPPFHRRNSPAERSGT